LFHQLRREHQNDRHNRHFWNRNPDATDEERSLQQLRWGLPYDGYPRDQIENSTDAYHLVLANQRQAILDDSTITEARRASLLARLDAAENADTPDNATIIALANMREHANRQRAAQDQFIRESAASLGEEPEEVYRRFRELEESIDRSRSAENPETYTRDNISHAERLGLSTEAGAVHAFITLREEARRREQESLADSPPLISRREQVSNGRVEDSPYEVLDYGYDAVSGYVEFTVKNHETGETTTEGYRGGMRAETLESGMRGEARVGFHFYASDRNRDSNSFLTPAEFWYENFQRRTYHRIDNEEERLRLSRAPRCARCGQFADNAHTCPAPLNQGPEIVVASRMLNNGVRTSVQKIGYDFTDSDGNSRSGEFSMDLPLVNDYRRQIKEHGSLLLRNVRAYRDWQDRDSGNYGHYSAVAEGDIYLYKDEDGSIKANTSSLRCQCLEYRENNGECRHTRAAGAAAIKRAIPPQRAVREMSEEERARRAAEKLARIEAANATDWTRNEETLAEARRNWVPNSEVVYSEDFDSFYEVYTKANEERAAKGSLTLPYKKEDALGGLATRESGQAFGVEIEYDFPVEMNHAERAEANRKIGQALKDANLTATAEKQGYHAAARSGYQDAHVDANGRGTWSWEHDATVAGEIVTPLMYDEPETWEKLETVTKILRDNGAVATTKAGAHVHVGTARYGKDPKKYEELARMVGQHEDVLYRISTDPTRGEHRGKSTRFSYVSPMRPVPPEGFSETQGLRRHMWQRTSILNLSGAKTDDNYKSSHVEFRMFDATLDPAVMQNQIKLAVTMTSAAERAAGSGGTLRPKESIGDHAERAKLRGRRKPKKEDIEQETATFRSLLDTLYQSKADKDAAIRLFAANDWVKLTAAQRRRHGVG